MLSRLLPRNLDFFTYFERHVVLVVSAAGRLAELAALGANERPRQTELAHAIKNLEHEADSITHQCLEALHKTFITPISRNDIHRLISGMDDVLDLIDGLARRMILYEVEGFNPVFRRGADVLVRMTVLAEGAVRGLRDLKNGSVILEACASMAKLEKEGDDAYAEMLADLFKHEHDPIELIKRRDLYEDLENAIDTCDDLANIIEGIVLEHA